MNQSNLKCKLIFLVKKNQKNRNSLAGISQLNQKKVVTFSGKIQYTSSTGSDRNLLPSLTNSIRFVLDSLQKTCIAASTAKGASNLVRFWLIDGSGISPSFFP